MAKRTYEQQDKIDSLEYLIRGYQNQIRITVSNLKDPERVQRDIAHDRETVNILLSRIQAAEDSINPDIAAQNLIFWEEQIARLKGELVVQTNARKVEQLQEAVAELQVLQAAMLALASGTPVDTVEDEDEDESEETEETSTSEREQVELEALWDAADAIEHFDDEAVAVELGDLPEGVE